MSGGRHLLHSDSRKELSRRSREMYQNFVDKKSPFKPTTTLQQIESGSMYRHEGISEAVWQQLERSSHEDQRNFLNAYGFKDELVSSEKRNVRRGDHIHHPGKFGPAYDHHLLVSKVDKNEIHFYDYTIPQGATKLRVCARSMTYEKMEMKKAKIRHWPVLLQRYKVDDVIARAESRKSEKEYDVFKNNCEHFVTWCKCGLSTSLQITPALDTAGHHRDAAVATSTNYVKDVAVSAGAIASSTSNALVREAKVLKGLVVRDFKVTRYY